MRSIAFADFLIGLGILFVLEGLMFAASPAWMRRAMKSALATPDNILRVVGIGSAVARLILLWGGPRQLPAGFKTRQKSRGENRHRRFTSPAVFPLKRAFLRVKRK